MPFSDTALLFFVTFVASADDLLKSKKDLGKFLLAAHEGLLLSPLDWIKYAPVLKQILAKYQWNMVPEDYTELAKLVWDVPAPASRKRQIGCQDRLTLLLARRYVQAFQDQHPNLIWRLLLKVYAPLMKSEGFDAFRKLGAYLIEHKFVTQEGPEEEWTWLKQAWELVRGHRPPLDLLFQRTTPSKPPEPQPEVKPAPKPKREPEQMLLIDPKEIEADTKEFEKYQTNSGLLTKLCFDCFREQYKDNIQRPYMCVYEHAALGWLFVACAVSGFNSQGQVVNAEVRFGHSGGPEVVHKHWDSVIGESDDTLDTGARVRLRAVDYVDGGYGKFWINVKDDSKTHNDVFERYFILRNKRIYIVSKGAYERRIRLAKKGSNPTPPPQSTPPKPTFDVPR